MDYKKSQNNFFCPHDVFEDKKFHNMSLSAQLLYTHLCKLNNRYSDNRGWFFRSIANLADGTGMNRRTIIRAKKSLRENEFIDVKRGFYEHSKKRTYDYFRLNGFRFMEK